MSPDQTSFDPRNIIRQKIGTEVYNRDENKTTYCIVVNDSNGNPHNIPMLLSENCRSGSLPEMPFIKMHRALATYLPHNIGGDVRFFKAWVDLKVYFTDIDGVTVADFKQAILNALQDGVRTNQSTTTGLYWMNIENERDVEENDGTQVTFVYIVTILVEHHDAC